MTEASSGSKSGIYEIKLNALNVSFEVFSTALLIE